VLAGASDAPRTAIVTVLFMPSVTGRSAETSLNGVPSPSTTKRASVVAISMPSTVNGSTRSA